MGCYRVGNAHRGALEHALSGAVNVIDTASLYLAGESERVIGQVLAGPLQARRQELVVVTKVGYLQGPVLQEAVERGGPQGCGWPELVKFHPQAWHCIHPDFLRNQLAASRARLNGVPDIVLLHNPEFFFTALLGREGAAAPPAPTASQQSEFYRRLQQAFEALEVAADEGQLGYYGLSTNPNGLRWSCSGLPNGFEATHLARVLEAAHAAARSAGRQQHRCKVLQIPCNLLEPEAFIGTSAEEGSVLEQASKLGLDVMIHRPINAIPPPGFNVGDWVRRESFIRLQDRRPQPPALALIGAVAREVLATHAAPHPYTCVYT